MVKNPAITGDPGDHGLFPWISNGSCCKCSMQRSTEIPRAQGSISSHEMGRQWLKPDEPHKRWRLRLNWYGLGKNKIVITRSYTRLRFAEPKQHKHKNKKLRNITNTLQDLDLLNENNTKTIYKHPKHIPLEVPCFCHRALAWFQRRSPSGNQSWLAGKWTNYRWCSL